MPMIPMGPSMSSIRKAKNTEPAGTKTKVPPPLFSFGHGLSYTSFDYQNLAIDASQPEAIKVEVTIKNTGSHAGSEVVQCYRDAAVGGIELIHFAKVHLAPGEEKRIRFHLGPESFRQWNTENHRWDSLPPNLEIYVGSSAEQLHLKEKVSGTP